jgi:tetratricopeptide (TPR) repeat protein
MNAVVTTADDPTVARWRARFAEDAAAAIGLALTGKVSLGPYDRARPADALVQILTGVELAQADTGLQAWLADFLGKPSPPGLSGKRFADALVEGFRLIALLHLPQARTWCANNVVTLRSWLRGFCLGNSRDPVAALMVALAQQQPDRSLLAFWHGIARHGQPITHVRHALTGLRLMPADDQGKIESRVPKALLRGLLDFGDAQARRGERKGADWLMELDYLAAVYPLSREVWSRQFRELVQVREPEQTVRNWLDQRYPQALKAVDNGKRHGVLQPPFFQEIEPLLKKMDGADSVARYRIAKFFDDSRHYCRESGDSYYLVRSYCGAGEHFLKSDPAWAQDLAHEATLWAPGNVRCWALLARALEAQGDWRRAEAIFWQTRRRFPEVAHCHTQLAHALLQHEQGDMAEAVAREAVAFFPNDAVSRSELAQTLKLLGRPDDALAEFESAQQRFYRDIVLANGKADLLVEMGRLEAAETALAWAAQIVQDDDARSIQVLARIRRALDNARAGKPGVPRRLSKPPDIGGGEFSAFSDITAANLAHAPALGQATLFRRRAAGDLAKSGVLIASLPDSPEKLVEHGLWLAASQDWAVAAQWFDSVGGHYEGDGVLRVHRQRAHARAGAVVDWASERTRFPDLVSVILTEEQGHPPHSTLPEHGEAAQEQLQDAWFAGLIAANDSGLRDRAEDDYLAARHCV